MASPVGEGWLPSIDDQSARLHTQQGLTALEAGVFFAVDVERLRLVASRDGDVTGSLELPWAPSALAAAARGDVIFLALAHGYRLSLARFWPHGGLDLAAHVRLPYPAIGAETPLADKALQGDATAADLLTFVMAQVSEDDGAKLSAPGRQVVGLDFPGGEGDLEALRGLLDAVCEVRCMALSGPGAQRALALGTANGVLLELDLGAVLIAVPDGPSDGPPPELDGPCAHRVQLPAPPMAIVAAAAAGPPGESPTFAVGCGDGSLCFVQAGGLRAVIDSSLKPRALVAAGDACALLSDYGADACQLACFDLAVSGHRRWALPVDGATTTCAPVTVATYGPDGDERVGHAVALATAAGRVDVVTLGGAVVSSLQLSGPGPEVDELSGDGEPGTGPGAGGDSAVVACHFGLYGKEPHTLVAVDAGGSILMRILSRRARCLEPILQQVPMSPSRQISRTIETSQAEEVTRPAAPSAADSGRAGGDPPAIQAPPPAPPPAAPMPSAGAGAGAGAADSPERAEIQAALDATRNDLRVKSVLLRTPVGRAAAMGLTPEAIETAKAEKAALEEKVADLQRRLEALSG